MLILDQATLNVGKTLGGLGIKQREVMSFSFQIRMWWLDCPSGPVQQSCIFAQAKATHIELGVLSARDRKSVV